ncbi:glycosyltransferase family 4 protein [Natrarchaeobius chitinivorans]|uniref:Glycosyltransferase family 1 protein n=1 Tax=Natrarchaeobius chitinivorans TaxID=1679083 RepID=A0A3N6M3C9_NATCH|nr:glycosyltransferase family 1 protein [Natrarchaeobius chitinivorans]RQG89701.1 glycosyltransferase family 1 protein [Natrarchaeobius chitinivorans]
MKIGINARTFTVDKPGGAVQTSIKHTQKLIDRSDTEIVLFGHSSLKGLYPDTTVDSSLCVSDSQVYGLVWERVALPQLVKKHELDVLYCPNGNAPATRIACPIVMCIHDVNAQKGLSSGIHQFYRRLAVPHGAKIADTIVTVSEFSKEEMLTHLEIDPAKIAVVYNGIDRLFLSAGEGDPVDLPEKYLLFVGSMNPRKNIRRVIHAFEVAKKDDLIPHKLVIIGPDNKSIFKEVSVDNTEDVRVLGFVTEEQLKYAYVHADAFVYPSLYEGFGLPPLEAMSCGTPVIGSDQSALPEVLGDAAILVEPTETAEISAAITELVTDEEYRTELIEKGREHAQTYTWEKSSRTLYDVLSKASEHRS